MTTESLLIREVLVRHPMSWSSMKHLLVEAALLRNQGNRSRAAAELGISIRAVRNLIKRYNIQVTREDFANGKA